MKNFVLGQYMPGDSYLHKLDPRLKIIATIVIMVAVFFLKNIYEMMGALLILIVILLSARLSILKVLQGLKPLIVLSIFVFVFQIFFNKGGEVLYQTSLSFSISSIIAIVVITFFYFFLMRYMKLKVLYFFLYVSLLFVSLKYLLYPDVYYSFNLEIYEEGMNTSLFVFFRLITVVSLATILTLTTKPTELTLGTEYLMKPLKIFKINPEEFALIISIALRYIPTILDESFKIMDAQASRGADFKQGSLTKKVGQLVSLLVPMFVISFERSDQLADAMESRNFVPGKPKTKYRALKWQTADTISLIFSLLLLGGSICLYILF
ncbi:MAG: energy-coupling factor transporter transmembrane protein EcfT [Bacillales bacterium]|nr:energy-coupling factor transporter transmembrane protein EcfT [Bacillales bacterium]